MIRVYLDVYYQDYTGGTRYDNGIYNAKLVLSDWLSQLTRDSWDWGILQVYVGVPRCIYFKNYEDATAFCLTYGLHDIVYENNI